MREDITSFTLFQEQYCALIIQAKMTFSHCVLSLRRSWILYNTIVLVFPLFHREKHPFHERYSTFDMNHLPLSPFFGELMISSLMAILEFTKT